MMSLRYGGARSRVHALGQLRRHIDHGLKIAPPELDDAPGQVQAVALQVALWGRHLEIKDETVGYRVVSQSDVLEHESNAPRRVKGGARQSVDF